MHEAQGFATSPCPAPTQPRSALPWGRSSCPGTQSRGAAGLLQMKWVKSGSRSPQLCPFKITVPLGAVGVQSLGMGCSSWSLAAPAPPLTRSPCSHCRDPRLGSVRGGDSVTQQFQTQEHLLRHRIINDFLVHPPSRKARVCISSVLKALPLSSVWLPLIAALTRAAARRELGAAAGPGPAGTPGHSCICA